MTKTTSKLLGAAALCVATLAPSVAPAAGLYYGDRGVRPLGRAGAFVAGADDLGAIAYNPAGFYDAGAQFLVDGSWMHFTSEYTRQAIVQQSDPNSGAPVGSYVQTYPQVHGTTPFLPIPTIVGSFRPHPKVVVAFGVFAPYATLASYPDPDSFRGKGDAAIANGAPQRYSLITLEGSALAVLAVGAAYAPIKELRVGATVGMLTGKFDSAVTFSGCVPDRFLCAQESPRWDVLAQLDAGPIFAPYGQLGAIWIPHPAWRVGASVELPVYVRSSATITTRLPATPIFEKATQQGDSASIAFDLPWTLRLGVETRLVDRLRVEAGFGLQKWKMHDAITVTPHQVALQDVALFPKQYFIPPVVLQRNFQDSFSARLGGEYALPVKSVPIDVRAGVSFESSAVPKEYLSVLTLDSDKVTVAVGGSVHLGRVRLDATYAHIFGFGVTVDPQDAKITQVSPVNANPSKTPDTINGGIYAARADVIGLGLAYTFGSAAEDAAPPAKQDPAPPP